MGKHLDSAAHSRRRQHEMQRNRSTSLVRESHERMFRNRQREQFLNSTRRSSNVGVHSPVEPYAGPKQFSVYHELVAKQLETGTQLKGRPPVPFTIRRDETLLRPYGGFRVYWREIEVGRLLSWPSYDDCKRLRSQRRHGAGPAERALLSDDLH